MILALQTTTFGRFGGIPAYNRLVCRVLDQIGHRASVNSHVLVATDSAADIEKATRELRMLRLQGLGGNRLAFTRRFLRLAITQKFDLVLLGHVNYGPLGLLLKQLRPQIRYGVMLYGIEAWRRLPPLRAQALRSADFMISISDYTRQRAVHANDLKVDRIHLLPNALEWEDNSFEFRASRFESSLNSPRESSSNSKFEARNSKLDSSAEREFKLLSVCRLEQSEQYKGVDKVIEALPQVAVRVPRVRYTVIGGGNDLERHRKLAEQLGVADRVNFSGSVDDETLRACYRDCDLFVLPSAGEGFGFVFLEAMKCSKAIVAANSGGAPEVVADGVTGRLVEYGDQEQLAQALVDLLLDPDMRHRLGQAGYQRLQEKFTFQQFKRTLTEILQRELPDKATFKFARPDESASCAS